MVPRGKFEENSMTEAQEAFWVGMTDQRVANMWDAADFMADLSPEAKEFLRRADKEKIKRLDSTLQFMHAATIIRKFLWIVGATVFGVIFSIVQFWDYVSKILTVKIK
jgi:hypothetical protein